MRGTISESDWIVPFPPAALDELEGALRELRRDPLPLLLLAPTQFALSACASVMTAVDHKLRRGVGLAVVDRIPVERFSVEENRALYWLLGSLLGRPVAQKWDGTMIYDVRDTGKPLEYGVRRSVTNLELQFHTDAPWLALPPEQVGLYCLNPAREGGVSQVVSLATVHNELQRRHPDLLPRFYRPFPWDRQAEHAPGDDKVAWQPMFRSDGRDLVARHNEALVVNAEALTGTPLDPEGREALVAMRAIAESPELRVEFTVERGQIQYLDNLSVAHSRTASKDAGEPHPKRHGLLVGGMQAMEGAGRTVCGFPDVPWEFTMDMARQVWDESRHVEIYLRLLEHLGGYPGEFPETTILWRCACAEDAAARVAGVNRGLEGLACDVFNQLVHIAGKLGDPILERAVEFVLADEITHVRMGSKWLTKLTEGDPERRRKAIEFQENIDERFNLGGVRREGDHEAVSISIATDVRRMAGFTEEEIERLVRTTQRSQVY